MLRAERKIAAQKRKADAKAVKAERVRKHAEVVERKAKKTVAVMGGKLAVVRRKKRAL